MQIFGAFDGDGAFRASDLFEREEFIIEYERRSGRTVNRRTLHYYDVMASWKCNVIVVANGLAAARSPHNHQEVLLNFLGGTARSEERREGRECFSTCRFGWWTAN